MKRVLLAATTIACSAYFFAALATPAQTEQLLTFIAQSDCKFVRNGAEHASKDAADHLRMKLSRAGDKVKTADQFIQYIASGSTNSGKPYTVRCPGRPEITSSVWLNAQLNVIRGKPVAEAQSTGTNTAALAAGTVGVGAGAAAVASTSTTPHTGSSYTTTRTTRTTTTRTKSYSKKPSNGLISSLLKPTKRSSTKSTKRASVKTSAAPKKQVVKSKTSTSKPSTSTTKSSSSKTKR